MQQLSLFEEAPKPEIELIDLYEAYFSCRKNKRNTANALAFEVDYEHHLYELWEQLNDGTYEVGRSIAFMVTKPVLREIFAADFRDRVVHHLLIGKLNALFEQQFIYDSYSCRVGKGTHFGVQRVDKFIRKCSQNYTRDCYVLKLDIEGFFMHINKPILFERLVKFIEQKYHEADKALLIELFRKVIFNDASKNCIVKGKCSDWDDLPKSKSLFHTAELTGLPIGNLTSQILANFYMDSFDHFIKHDLRIKYYGRYVDDFIIVHEDKAFLKSLLPILSEFLSDNLKLKIHPRKIYFQHYSKGVKFIGVVLHPNRIYIGNRTKGNFYAAIEKQNKAVITMKPEDHHIDAFLSSMNSYLGIMKHYKSYRIRKKMIFKNLSRCWWNYVYLSRGVSKFVARKKSRFVK